MKSRLLAAFLFVSLLSPLASAFEGFIEFKESFGRTYIQVEFPDGQVKTFDQFEIIYNRQFRMVDLKLRDSFFDENLELYVQPNNWVQNRFESISFYGGSGLFEQLKYMTISYTSHFGPCQTAFEI